MSDATPKSSDAKPAFDMSSIGAALADITNGKLGSKPDSKNKDDGASKDKEAWVPREAYDYRVYNAQTREERELLEADEKLVLPDWAANAQKYEWSDEYGDIGPEHPDLEKQLFGGDFLVRRGQELEKLTGIRVAQESKTRISPIMKFEDAGLHPIMLKNVKLCGYEVCTPIQAYCIPAILQGHDVFASAQTGSGKTAAFLIPMLSKLMGKAKIMAAPRPNPSTFNALTDSVRAEPLVVIVSPTRELATQIFDEARRFCYRSMLRPSVVYGGAPLRDQIADLRRGCDVLIGTPGRLCDLMDRAHILSLKRVRYTVVDEADEMLDMDWEEQIRRILHGGDNNPDDDHQYLMFSATFPKRARELARHFLAVDHVQVRVGRPGSTHVNIRQQIIWVEEDQKKRALYDLLLALPPARTIIFVNSKRTADLIDDYLFNLDLPSTSIHADRTQREREDALRAFRKGRAPILVATGVSARGLDIRDVMHIVNYDLPSTAHGGIDEYVHRIGRTARIGNIGLASSFYNDRNEDIAEVLVKTLLEADQQVPDFLSQYVDSARATPGGKIDFDDSSSSSGASENGNPTVDDGDDNAGDKEQASADEDMLGDIKPKAEEVKAQEVKAEEVKTMPALDPVAAAAQGSPMPAMDPVSVAARGLTPVAAAAHGLTMPAMDPVSVAARGLPMPAMDPVSVAARGFTPVAAAAHGLTMPALDPVAAAAQGLPMLAMDPVSVAARGFTLAPAAGGAATPTPARAPLPTPAASPPSQAPAAAPAAPSILGTNGGETKAAKASPPADFPW